MLSSAFLEWGLDDWCKRFANLYSETDMPRSYGEIWLQVVARSSELGELVRRSQYESAIYKLADICAWLLSFAGRLDKENEKYGAYSKWILDKYPLVCHVCGLGKCICSSHRDISENRNIREEFLQEGIRKSRNAKKSLSKSPTGRAPLTLDGFVNMFEKIYGGSVYGTSLDEVAFHFLEEIGEVSIGLALLGDLENESLLGAIVDWEPTISAIRADAIRFDIEPRFSLDRLEGRPLKSVRKQLRTWLELSVRDELADVFSWIASLLYKLNQILRQSKSLANLEVTLAPGEPPRISRGRGILLSNLLASKVVNEGSDEDPRWKGYVSDASFACPFCGEPSCSASCVARDFLRRLANEVSKRARHA
jgi:NTP pyrophosphatase (non-canonical NTP hydrolase)